MDRQLDRCRQTLPEQSTSLLAIGRLSKKVIACALDF
jgi:hypothetical protein